MGLTSKSSLTAPCLNIPPAIILNCTYPGAALHYSQVIPTGLELMPRNQLHLANSPCWGLHSLINILMVHYALNNGTFKFYCSPNSQAQKLMYFFLCQLHHMFFLVQPYPEWSGYTRDSHSSLFTESSLLPLRTSGKMGSIFPVSIGLTIAIGAVRIGTRPAGFVKQNQILTAKLHFSVDIWDHMQRLPKTLSFKWLAHESLAQMEMDNRLVLVIY